jgi:hypothetical protein
MMDFLAIDVQYIRVSDSARVMRLAGLASSESEEQMRHAGAEYDRQTQRWRSLGVNPAMARRRPPTRRLPSPDTDGVSEAAARSYNTPVWMETT